MQSVSTQSSTTEYMPEARYAYYRRCQVFRKGGEQCKAPAEKGREICHAHASQQATLLRRERERQAVLAEAVAVMRRRGKAECEANDLFTNFTGIQVTLAVAAQALINGRIDCKTAGRLAWNLQTMARLLRMVHGKRRQTSPRINTDATDRKEYTRVDALPPGAESGLEERIQPMVVIRRFERIPIHAERSNGPPRSAKAA
jgi:hypothetical protein